MHGLQAERRTSLNLAIRRRLSLVAFAVLLVDLLSKSIALKYLTTAPFKVIGSFVQLELAANSGAAFSLAQGKTLFLSLFGFLAILAIFWWGAKLTSQIWAVALGIILGGVLGNEVDRVFRASSPLQGRVIDWIKLPHWPIFNLADTSIVIGAGLIVYLSMRGIKPISHDRSA